MTAIRTEELERILDEGYFIILRKEPDWSKSNFARAGIMECDDVPQLCVVECRKNKNRRRDCPISREDTLYKALMDIIRKVKGK